MNDFISEESIQNDSTKSLGIVRLEKRTDSILVSFAHTTPGMNIGKVTTYLIQLIDDRILLSFLDYKNSLYKPYIVIQSSHSKKPEIFFSENNDSFTAVSHKIPLKL